MNVVIMKYNRINIIIYVNHGNHGILFEYLNNNVLVKARQLTFNGSNIIVKYSALSSFNTVTNSGRYKNIIEQEIKKI